MAQATQKREEFQLALVQSSLMLYCFLKEKAL